MSVATQVQQICQKGSYTLVVAESVTAGNLQALIASVSGASAYFEGGITTYNLEQKVTHLGIDRAYAASVNCVAPRVAIQMALGARRLFNTFSPQSWVIATTGYAEPHEASQPHAYIAVTNGLIESVRRFEAPAEATRIQVQQSIAEQALLFFLEVVG